MFYTKSLGIKLPFWCLAILNEKCYEFPAHQIPKHIMQNQIAFSTHTNTHSGTKYRELFIQVASKLFVSFQNTNVPWSKHEIKHANVMTYAKNSWIATHKLTTTKIGPKLYNIYQAVELTTIDSALYAMRKNGHTQMLYAFVIECIQFLNCNRNKTYASVKRQQ